MIHTVGPIKGVHGAGDAELLASCYRRSLLLADLTSGKERQGGLVRGGAMKEFHAPDGYPSFPHYKDWLLHLTKVTRQ